MNYAEIEKRLNYTFKNKKLLKKALTLASADADFNNQTLEFFGDAILEFLVSEHIFDQNKSEGELTEIRKQLVSDKALTPVSNRLGLSEFFIKSQGDNVLKKSIPSAYEAVLAAIYLDGGMDSARRFVEETLNFSPSARQINYKGKLQELLQSQSNPLPVYTHIEKGTPQSPRFISRITVCGQTFEGEAASVKQADQLAAQRAYKKLTHKN